MWSIVLQFASTVASHADELYYCLIIYFQLLRFWSFCSLICIGSLCAFLCRDLFHSCSSLLLCFTIFFFLSFLFFSFDCNLFFLFFLKLLICFTSFFFGNEISLAVLLVRSLYLCLFNQEITRRFFFVVTFPPIFGCR